MTMTLPIGIFDSGVGGLTVLDALHHRLPHESLLYLGDTARLPYGTKSPDTVCRYAVQATRLLVAQGIKALVVADNTSSAHALDALCQTFPGLPIFNVLHPGVAAAARVSRNGQIGVLATEGVVENDLYAQALRQLDANLQVSSTSCSLLVPLAEEGLVRGPLAEAMVRHILTPLQGRCDTLLLGCTHLPPLRPVLAAAVGDQVTLVDSATTTAEAVVTVLTAMNLLAPTTETAQIQCLVTDTPERFARLAPIFLHGLTLEAQHIRPVTLEGP